MPDPKSISCWAQGCGVLGQLRKAARAAKNGKQLGRLVSTAPNRSGSAPERKAIDEGVAEGVMA
jgi:hypothetical protein